jgi:uncharacterized membrane protein/mono/diheme cytochrome c family protein
MNNLLELIGRLHPLLVHLPIGFLMMTLGFHWLVWRGKYGASPELLPLLWLVSGASAVLACLAGYLLSLSGDYDQQALNIHMYLGIALALCCGLVYLLVRRGFSGRGQYLAVAGVAGLLLAAGHYGGNLTHGQDYLTQPLYALLGKVPEKKVRPPITNINQALVYQDLVEPILEQKCWQCHSSQKQKGKLRLDAAEYIVKGGKHGPVLAAGNAGASELYQRLLLPETDDKRMPPKGKPQLTEPELLLIQWWISKGEGNFKKKVADLQQDAAILPVLAALESGSPAPQPFKTVSEIPQAKVAKPNPADLQKLRDLGVALSPLTPDHVFLAANLVNNPEFTDQHLPLLLKLHHQLVWLDLSETAITDKAMPLIAQFQHLTRLKLDNTAITDAGLVHLQKLAHLRTLNLYGTQVSDKGLQQLAGCKTLKSIYLWQTRATTQGVAALQQALGPQVEINFNLNADLTDSL